MPFCSWMGADCVIWFSTRNTRLSSTKRSQSWFTQRKGPPKQNSVHSGPNTSTWWLMRLYFR